MPCRRHHSDTQTTKLSLYVTLGANYSFNEQNILHLKDLRLFAVYVRCVQKTKTVLCVAFSVGGMAHPDPVAAHEQACCMPPQPNVSAITYMCVLLSPLPSDSDYLM